MNPDEANRIILAFLRVKNKDKWDRYWSKLKMKRALERIGEYNEIYYGGACSGRCIL